MILPSIHQLIDETMFVDTHEHLLEESARLGANAPHRIPPRRSGKHPTTVWRRESRRGELRGNRRRHAEARSTRFLSTHYAGFRQR